MTTDQYNERPDDVQKNKEVAITIWLGDLLISFSTKSYEDSSINSLNNRLTQTPVDIVYCHVFSGDTTNRIEQRLELGKPLERRL